MTEENEFNKLRAEFAEFYSKESGKEHIPFHLWPEFYKFVFLKLAEINSKLDK